jgi:SET domain-containing protein
LDDKGRFVFRILATRDILPEEELFLNYGKAFFE